MPARPLTEAERRRLLDDLYGRLLRRPAPAPPAPPPPPKQPEKN